LEETKWTKQLRKKVLDNLQKISEFPVTALESLDDAFESGKAIDSFNVQKITGINGQKIEPLLMLISEKQLDSGTLHLMIQSVLAQKKKTISDVEESELTWTGPTQLNVNVRDTSTVIEEMLRDARRITLIAYSITEGAEDIIKALSKCAADGVNDITIVVDDDKKMINKTTIDNIFVVGKKPLILTRKEKGQLYYKVHAKVLIVNSWDMLVTSANMTYHGMSENFEMGIRTKGRLAEKAEELICKLKENGYFEEMD